MYLESSIISKLKQYSSQKGELVVSGGLTDAYLEFCECLGAGITASMELYEATATFSNIFTNGGICTTLGPLSGSIGNLLPSGIIGSLENVYGNTISNFPNSNFVDITEAFNSFLIAIGTGFETTFNQKSLLSTLSNIQVNGGVCTCQIIAGVPIPGTYFGGTGQLPILYSNTDFILDYSTLYANITNNLDSNILPEGTMTDSLKASIEAITEAIVDMHITWLQTTSVTGIQVNGGVTLPNQPIINALGAGGIFQ